MFPIRNPQGALVKRRAARATHSSQTGHKPLTHKGLTAQNKMKAAPDPEAAARHEQMKAYEEALGLFQQQKFSRAKQALEKVLEGPSK
jgi:TolA-binding protein